VTALITDEWRLRRSESDGHVQTIVNIALPALASGNSARRRAFDRTQHADQRPTNPKEKQ